MGDEAGSIDLQMVGSEREAGESGDASGIGTEAAADTARKVVKFPGGLHGGPGGISDFEAKFAGQGLGAEGGRGGKRQDGDEDGGASP